MANETVLISRMYLQPVAGEPIIKKLAWNRPMVVGHPI
jgi:hypothetical protein